MSKKEKPIPKGREIDGSIATEMDARFLNRRYFIGNGTIGLTIDRVEQVDELEYENGQKDYNVKLAYFKEYPKPLKLCNTNIDSIIFLTGTSKPKDWAGCKIGFMAVKGRFYGKDQYAVRVDEKWKEAK